MDDTENGGEGGEGSLLDDDYEDKKVNSIEQVQYQGDDNLNNNFNYKCNITKERLKQVQTELGLIKLSWQPDVNLMLNSSDDQSWEKLPDTYKSVSEKEKLLLWYAENFRKQYHTVYPQRKPLLMACDNECGVQKFVSTTIRRSKLSYPELHTWYGCARFVCDHFLYESLRKPLALPNVIRSPTWMLNNQRGNSFELAIFLVSLLLGQGYNAFVVSGYASRDQTLCDTSKIHYKFKDDDDPSISPSDEPSATSKYHVNAPPDFQSKLLLVEIENDEAKLNNEQLQANDHFEKSKEEINADEFWGRRVHGWVVLIPEVGGSRQNEINEPLFIEPTTGQYYSINSHTDLLYHGVESIWNDRNYFVNMQTDLDGCSKINWNIRNIQFWEHLLPGEVDYSSTNERDSTAPRKSTANVDKHLDMPVSYVQQINVLPLDYERRYPNGQKTVHYKRTEVKYYAPYTQLDGLVKRITIFLDDNYKLSSRIFEKYLNRGDKLIQTKKYCVTGLIIDLYSRGRPDAIKEHSYYSISNILLKNERTLKFYNIRSDCLVKIALDANHIYQHFDGRDDFLQYKAAEFAPETDNPLEDGNRDILKIVEEFDPKHSTEQRVAIREFEKNQIQLLYHYKDYEISRATRTFVKPSAESVEKADRFVFNSETTVGYNASGSTEKISELYSTFECLLRDEEQSLSQIKDIQVMVDEFLKNRQNEYQLPKLLVSEFDRRRNNEIQAEMSAKEKLLSKAQEHEGEKIDYAAPYLARLGDPKELTKNIAITIHEECLKNFKETVAKRVSNVQNVIHGKMKDLENLQYQYQKLIQSNDDSPRVEETLEEIDSLNFEINSLYVYLNRINEQSNDNYENMVANLKKHKRLNYLLE